MEVFVARQPIFDTADRVVGYELLHRSSAANSFSGVDGRLATGQLLSENMLGDAWEALTSGVPAWINFPEELLLDGSATLVPTDQIVVEVLEDVRGGDDIVEACHALRRQGYRLAADDVVDADDPNPLLDIADIVKVDFREATPTSRAALARRFHRKTLLAEKVETQLERQIAVDLGYTLLQGYYLHHPTMVQQRAIDRTRFGILAVLQAVTEDPMDFAKVEQALKSEVALTDKLLRYLNSAAFAWRRQITSLRAALVTLGELQTRRWVSVIALSTISADKPSEVLVSTLMRARMCEELAAFLGPRASGLDLFLAGLYSQMHLLMDADRDTTLRQAPLPEHIRAALLDEHGVLWDVLELVRRWEMGDWKGVEAGAHKAGVDVRELPGCYSKALEFVGSLDNLGAAA